MRLLLDSCISPSAANELRQAGHDVDWVGDWGADSGDEEIRLVPKLPLGNARLAKLRLRNVSNQE